MPAILPAIAAGVGIFNGVRQMTRGSSDQTQATQQGAAQADPFAAMRPYFQAVLQNRWDALSNPDPAAILKNPNFQFLKDQGLSAIDRASSTDSTLRSGRRAQEGAQFTEGLSSNFIQQQFEDNMRVLGFLGGAAGVGFGDPGAAGRITAGGPAASSNMIANGANAIGSGLQGLGRYFQPGASPWNPNFTAPGGGPIYTGYDSGGGPAYG